MYLNGDLRNKETTPLAALDGARLREVPGWGSWAWLRAGFAVRRGGVSTVYDPAGDLNLGFTAEDEADAVGENRRRLNLAAGGGWTLVVPRQVHGTAVRTVGAADVGDAMAGGRGRWEADGLITRERGLLLGVGAADCVPLLVADLRQRAAGAFHAGWRGTVDGMVEAGLRSMREAFATEPKDCVAAIGPSIGSCCYEVAAEVRDRVLQRWGVLAEKGERPLLRGGERAGRWQLDLWEANRRELVAAGVPNGAVTVLAECTACTRDADDRRRYFSHRAEQGRTGRMLGVIGLVGEGEMNAWRRGGSTSGHQG